MMAAGDLYMEYATSVLHAQTMTCAGNAKRKVSILNIN